MNTGKKEYDNIPIPAELDEVIACSIRRAERSRHLHALKRTAACAAAVFCVLFASANIMPIYTYAAQIPVLGSIVQVLQIGSGGEVTDGAHGGAESYGDSVQLSFDSDSGKLDYVPHYSVAHYSAPNRVVMTFRGVRGMDFDELRESLLASEAVSDAYRMMILDDSAFGIVVVLNDGWSCEVAEYSDPGALMINFSSDETVDADAEVYYLRTEAMPYTDELGLLCEKYHNEGASQLKTANGDYIVTIGQYESESEALQALEELNKTYGDQGLFVSAGAANELPED